MLPQTLAQRTSASPWTRAHTGSWATTGGPQSAVLTDTPEPTPTALSGQRGNPLGTLGFTGGSGHVTPPHPAPCTCPAQTPTPVPPPPWATHCPPPHSRATTPFSGKPASPPPAWPAHLSRVSWVPAPRRLPQITSQASPSPSVHRCFLQGAAHTAADSAPPRTLAPTAAAVTPRPECPQAAVGSPTARHEPALTSLFCELSALPLGPKPGVSHPPTCGQNIGHSLQHHPRLQPGL